MKETIRKLGHYATISAAMVGAPILSEISGCTNRVAVDAVEQNERIRNRYPKEMRQYYKGVAYDSARYLTDILAVGVGLLAGASIAGNAFKRSK